MPQNVRIESGRKHTLRIRWDAMPQEEYNGPLFSYVIHWKCVDVLCAGDTRYEGVHKMQAGLSNTQTRQIVIDNQVKLFRNYSSCILYVV